jgi:hypothetical protein
LASLLGALLFVTLAFSLPLLIGLLALLFSLLGLFGASLFPFLPAFGLRLLVLSSSFLAAATATGAIVLRVSHAY